MVQAVGKSRKMDIWLFHLLNRYILYDRFLCSAGILNPLSKQKLILLNRNMSGNKSVLVDSFCGSYGRKLI